MLRLSSLEWVESMKAHLPERSVKGFQPKWKTIIVYDEEVVGFGVRITSGGTRAFILTYRIEARERRLTIGAWPDWPVTAAREEAKRLKREIDQRRDPMAERDEARESPNVRQLIDRYLEEHAAKLAKRNRDDQASMLRKLVEPAWGPRKAAEIQPDDVDNLLRQIASGTPGKRGRKPTPVRANRIGEILRKMFNLSIRWRIRADNPAAGFARNAEAPRDRYLSTDEIGRLSVALDAHPNWRAADAVRLILLTGARRGEVLGAPLKINSISTPPSGSSRRHHEATPPKSRADQRLRRRAPAHHPAARAGRLRVGVSGRSRRQAASGYQAVLGRCPGAGRTARRSHP